MASLRSFRGAAAELGVSPSALSHAVASVERRLGVRLFNRSTRSVSLTEAGAAFLARVQPALREIDEGLLLASRPTHFRGHLFEVKGVVLERQMTALKEQGDLAGAERAKAAAIKAYDEAIDIQNKVIESALPDGGPTRAP